MTSQFSATGWLRLISIVLIILTGSVVGNDDWSQFRGSDLSGVAARDSRPAVEWSADDIAWKTDLPGVGWSSPVFDQGMVWMTSAITEEASPEEIASKRKGVEYPDIKTVAGSVELRAICVDLKTGSLIHNLSLRLVDDPELINPMNSYASPTPAIADGKVVCHFGTYGTWCLDEKTGETIWHNQFKIDHSVGPGSSPLIYQNKVLLVNDGIDQQFVAAVSLQTGEEIWRTSRPPMTGDNGEHHKGYSTPLIIEVNGQVQAVVPGSQWIVAYDPATGSEIWRANHGRGFSVTPMAIYESGLIVFSTGYTRPEFVAVDPTGKGDVTDSHIRWRARNAPTMPSFIAHEGKIYAIADKGILICLDAATGEVLNRARVGGNHSASPLLADGKLYLCSREGVVAVVKCTPELEILATNQLDSSIMASPAVVGNDLIIRTEQKIYRIEN